jgi:hypothetical protein
MPKGPSTASECAQLPREPLEHKLPASSLCLLYALQHILMSDVRTEP